MEGNAQSENLASLPVEEIMKNLSAVTDYQTQIDFLLLLPYPLLLEVMETTEILDDNFAFWQTKFGRDFPNESQKIFCPELWQTKYQAVYAESELKKLTDRRVLRFGQDPELAELVRQEEEIKKKIAIRDKQITDKLDEEEEELRLEKASALYELEQHDLYFVCRLSVKDHLSLLSRARDMLPANGSFEVLKNWVKIYIKEEHYNRLNNANLIMIRSRGSPEEQAPIILIYIWRDLNGELHYDSTRQYYYARKPGITRFPLRLSVTGTEEEIRARFELKFQFTPAEERCEIGTLIDF